MMKRKNLLINYLSVDNKSVVTKNIHIFVQRYALTVEYVLIATEVIFGSALNRTSD